MELDTPELAATGGFARRPAGEAPHDTDDLLVAALAAGCSYAAAGEIGGCSAKTVQRRMADPAFATEVARARFERIDRITGELAGLGTTAVSVIREAMGDGNPIKTRLAAATASLRHLREFRSAADLERRLQEVEELAAELAAAQTQAAQR